MTDLTVLITAYREPTTIRLAIESILPQIADRQAEVIVICPDEETAQAAAFPGVAVLHDPGRGKPAALNMGLEQATGNVIIMTDGDVYVGAESIPALLEPFSDPHTGAVSGRPVSLNPKETMLGYWSHLLTEAGAHAERLKRDSAGQFFVCSGYLYAIRRGLVEHIPEDALAEDAVVSHLIGEQGYVSAMRRRPRSLFVTPPLTPIG